MKGSLGLILWIGEPLRMRCFLYQKRRRCRKDIANVCLTCGVNMCVRFHVACSTTNDYKCCLIVSISIAVMRIAAQMSDGGHCFLMGCITTVRRRLKFRLRRMHYRLALRPSLELRSQHCI